MGFWLSKFSQTPRSSFKILEKVRDEVEFFSNGFSLNGSFSRFAKKTARIAREYRRGDLKIRCYTSLGLDPNQGEEHDNLSNRNIRAEKVIVDSEMRYLADLHKLGCEVIWIPHLKENYVVVDHNSIYFYDDKAVSNDFWLNSQRVRDEFDFQLEAMGFFSQFSDKIALIQELEKQDNGGIDFFVRLAPQHLVATAEEERIPVQIHATMPVFVHSSWLDHDLEYGAVIQVLGITNRSGRAVTGEEVASPIFNEGLSVRQLSQSDGTEYPNHSRLHFRDEFLNLIRSDPAFSPRSRNSTIAENKEALDNMGISRDKEYSATTRTSHAIQR